MRQENNFVISISTNNFISSAEGLYDFSYPVPPIRSVFPDYGPYTDFFEEIGPYLVWKVRFCIKVVVVGEICNMGGAKMS